MIGAKFTLQKDNYLKSTSKFYCNTSFGKNEAIEGSVSMANTPPEATDIYELALDAPGVNCQAEWKLLKGN